MANPTHLAILRHQKFNATDDQRIARLDNRLHQSKFRASAPLAQLAEQLTLNQRVVGSSPTWRISTPIRAFRFTLPAFPR